MKYWEIDNKSCEDGLKQEISFKQARYYEPVLDMVPGEQCQIDGGELKQLRKENKNLRIEKEILKKASAFFAKEMK